MTKHRHPHPGASSLPQDRRTTAGTGAISPAEEIPVIDHQRDEHALSARRPASAQSGERTVRIRQRVAEGAYNDPAVVAQVARRLLDSGDLP